jgi:hypothetical protein
VTFDLKPAIFPDSGLDGSGGNLAVSLEDDERAENERIDDDDNGDHGDETKNTIQTGVVRERVRELELGESMSSGEFEVGKQLQQQQRVVESEGKGAFHGDDGDGDGDSGDENGDDWEEERESNGTPEGLENEEAAMPFAAKEEEALVRKQRPNNIAQQESGNGQS